MQRDDAADALVLMHAQHIRGHLAPRGAGTKLEQAPGTQKAADVVRT
jgi:hypothetical protein